MRILNQIKLIFWKNLLLRFRSPGILILELLWPVLVVGIVSIMRLGAQPHKRGNCHYQSRAMPSAGAVQFLQTFVCNLNNKCYRSEQYLKLAESFTQPFTDLSQNLGPLLASDQVLDILEVSDQTVQVLNTMKEIMGDKEMLHGLDAVMNISSYFKDPGKVKQILVNDQKLLSWDQAEALLDAQFNIEQLLNLTGIPDFKDVACNPNKLELYVKFPEGSNVTSLSSSLCNIQESQISDLSNLLIQEVDISTLIDAINAVESLKGRFEGDGLRVSFEIIADMFEAVMKSEPLIRALGKFTDIPNIADLIREIPSFIRNFNDFNSVMKVLREVVSALDPVMKSLDVDKSPYWLIAKDASHFADHFTSLIEEKWNGTSEELIQPLKSLVTNFKNLTNDEGSALFMAVLDFISKNNWLTVYDEIIHTRTLSDRTINTMAKSMQDILEQTSIWSDLRKGLRLAYHALDMMSIVTEKSIELRHSLKKLFDSDEKFVKVLNDILQYGPVVTTAFLDTIRNTYVIGDIMRTASTYQSVCERVVFDMRGKVPDDIHSHIKDILCSEDKDFAKALSDVADKLKLSEISDIINKTVQDVEMLYEGEFFTDAVELADFFPHYSRFTKAINDYLYDDLTWTMVFDGTEFDSIVTNERGWEPVTDMLNEDYISSLIWGLYQGFGQVLGNSRISDGIGPGVHVLSELIESIYKLFYYAGQLTSTDSQMVKLVHLFTSYMPEMISGISYMWHNNMKDLYSVVGSQDPLKTFCDYDFIHKMNLPAYVPSNEMNNILCKTDWNSFMKEMENTEKSMESTFVQLTDAFNINESASYNVEMDWNKMVDYSSRFWDLIRMGEVAGIIDLTSSSISFFNQLNFSRIEEAMEVLSTELNRMETEDVEKFMELSLRVLENLDKSDVLTRDWLEIRRYMAIIDAYVELQLDTMRQTQTVTSLSDMLKLYPKDMRTITVLLSKAYPQFVQALANMFYNPEDYINTLLKDGLHAPDCKTHFIMDYTNLPQDSAPHDLERFICDMNFTDFINQLMEAQPSSNFTQLLTNLLEGKPVDATINWNKMISNVKEYFTFFDSTMTNLDTGFDLSPFNVTEINLSWEEFYRAAETLGHLDSARLGELLSKIGMISTEFLTLIDGNESGLKNAIYFGNYVNHITLKLLIEELKYFNESSEIIVFDYLGSDELRKLSSFLMKSPDINAVGVATLHRLITSPEKASITFDFESLCSNLTLFKDVFVTEVSPLQPVILQNTVCNEIININITLVIEQLTQNRDSLKNFIDDLSIFETNYTTADIQIPIETLVKESEQLSHLITDLTKDPPVIKITADEAWMNMTLYAQEWEKLGDKLGKLFNDAQNASPLENIETSVVKAVVNALESLADSSEMFHIMDVIIDVMQIQVDQISGDFVQGIRKYPNGKKVIDLLESAPEAIQTILYTVLTQPNKTAAWTEALQSWDNFCGTPSDTIFTVPPGIQFNMADFLSKACSIDIEELGREMGEYQGTEKLMNLFSNNPYENVNTSTIQEKMTHLIKSFTSLVEDPEDMADLDLRLINVTIWNKIGERVANWAAETGNSIMSSDDIIDIINEAITGVRKSLPPEAVEIFDKAVAITDVVLTEMHTIFNASSLEEAFKEIPNMDKFISLLQHVPELFESLLYTSINHPQQISAKLSGVMSIAEFCNNKPEQLLTSAPNTNFALKEWMEKFCSIDMTQFVEDLMQYKVVKQIRNYIENPVTRTNDLSSVIKKAEKLIDQLQGDIDLEDRVFNPSVWDDALQNINTWIWPYKSVEEFIAELQQNLAVGVVTYLENMPGSSDALKYLDAALDIIGRRTSDARENLPEAFNGFPTLKIMVVLLEHAPEMIETALYTVMTQPDKTAEWSDALMSFSKFCATPVSEIMKSPPDSSFNVTAYLGKLCSIDLDNLVNELISFQGIDRFSQIENGIDTQAVNATLVTQKLRHFLASLEDYYNEPLDTTSLNLRLFNATVWNEIGQRIEQWSNTAMNNYRSEQNIADIINHLFGSIKESSPELNDAYQKTLKITAVLTDQILDILKEGSIEDAFKDIPSIGKLLHLADSAPELFEVLVYTSLNNPEKVTSRAEALTSMESFCVSNPESMFSIPPDSTFDLNSWLSELCSLNMTDIETQLSNFQVAMDIEKIIHDSSNLDANVTSIVLKIENLIEQFNKGIMPEDRFLNESIWSRVMSRISNWISDEDLLMKIPYLSAGGFFLVMDQLTESDPALKELFQPVAAMMVVMDDLMSNILHLQNKTHFGITELVDGWTNMQQLLRFIQHPGVIDVLIASTSAQSFSSLFSEEGLNDFCLPSTDPAKYLNAPKSTAVDLTEIKNEFCKIDFENFMDNFDSFINTHKLEKVASGSMDYDWAGLENKIKQMDNLVNNWIKQPPTFDLPSHWKNETYWQNVLDSQILPLQDSLTTKDEVINLINQLAPLLELDGFRQVGIVLNSVLDIINENIKSMEGNEYTVENMFRKVPALRELFDAFGLDSDTVQSLLIAPVKNSTLFAEILMSNDIQNDFCAGDKWNEVIKFPDNFKTSALHSAFCNSDIDALLAKLKTNFNLETMISALADNKSHINDWKNATAKMYTLFENFESLLENSPKFNAKKTLSILNDSYNITTLMELASAYSVLQQTFMNESDVFQPLSSVFNIAQVMVNFLDDIMARIKLQNGNLDLASLFKDVPEFQKLVKSVLEITPDPVTGLFAVQLHPEKVDDFINLTSNSSQLMNLFCSKKKFENIFDVNPKVNITSVLEVLCGFDFTALSEKLSESFKIDSLTNEIELAMRSDYTFNEEEFTEAINNLISHIINLTHTNQVQFQDHDLAKVFMLNYTQLMEELNGQADSLGSAFMGDYAAISSQIVASVLKGMGSLTNIDEVSSALRFIQTYLHSFNSFMKSIKDHPISLTVLLNNTEIGSILNPILTNPHSLESLKDATINVKMISDFLSRPSPEDAFCSNELWSAVNISETGRQTFLDIQTHVCSLNQSLLLWQTVMLQANGYNLHQQIMFIEKDVQQGRTNVDIDQVGKEMSEFISLMNLLITQYVNGSRSFDDIIDVNGFKDLLDSLQSQLSKKLMETAGQWSVDIAEILLPQVLDQNLYQSMAKTLNTVNLFMNATIEHLQRIKDGTISASTLFNNADVLINVMEAYIRTGKNIAKAWSNNEFNMEKLETLFGDMDLLTSLCAQPEGISMEISNTTNPSQIVKDFSTVICSVAGTNMIDELKQSVDYDHIEKTLMLTWKSSQVVPEYSAFVNNVNSFTSLLEYLSSTSFNVSSRLTELFKFNNVLDDIENIAQSPEVIFRLLKILGIAIESPLHNEPEIVKVLSQANSFALMPLVHILEALQAKGLTLMNMANNPDALLEIMSVAVDFNVHYKIIKEITLKPQIQMLQMHLAQWCSDADYRYLIESRVSDMDLPVNGRDVLIVVCNSSSSEWLRKFKDMGLTNIQTVTLFDQLTQGSDLTDMYDQNFGWVDLMSSLEQLTSLIADSNEGKNIDVRSAKTAWENIKNLVFDKSFKSLLSYLQLFEGASQPYDENWIKFKQFLNFFSSVMKFVDNNLDEFNNDMTPIQFKDILPNSEQVSMLLEDLFGQQNAGEFLAAAVNPTMFYRIGMSDTWDEICKGPNTKNFTMYFQFPSGTNVAALKKSFCQAALTRKTSFQQLLSLFSAGDMLKQLDILIEGKYNAMNNNMTVWDATHSVMMHLIGTLENLQDAMIDDSSVDEYFTPVVEVLNSLSTTQNSQLINMCNALVLYLNETEGYMDTKPIMSYVITTINLVTDIVSLTPDLDEIVCTLGGSENIDIVAFVQKLTDLGLMKTIDKAVSEYMTIPNSLQCSAPISSSETIINILNATLSLNLIDVSKMENCLKEIERGARDIVSSVTNAADFLRSIGTVLQMPGLDQLFKDKEWMPMIDLVIDSVYSSRYNPFRIGDLLADKERVIEYFTTVIGLSDSFVDSFINATVSDKWMYIFTNSVDEIEDILCNHTRLSQVISLPEGLMINMADISKELCTPNTAYFLKNTSLSYDTISQLMKPNHNVIDVVSQLSNDIANLLIDFDDLLEFLFNLMTNFSFEELDKNADIIDNILQKEELTDLGNRANSILNGIRSLFDDDSSTQRIIDDLVKIVDGLQSVDIVKDTTMKSLQVKDLVEDPNRLRNYMLNELGISEEIVNEIMDGAFSIRLILGLDDSPQYSCEEIIRMLIIMNDTRVTDQDLRNAFCGLNQDQLKDLFNALKVQLDIGTLVAKYVSYTADSILKSTNLTKMELNDVVEKIDRGQYFLGQATDTIYNNPNGSDFLKIFHQSSSSQALTGLNRLTPLICGEDVIDVFATDFTPGIVISTTEDLAQEIKDGIRDNIDDLPNEFCIDVYEAIRESSIGSILWAYLKPIMRGKILYTPVNAVTQEIVKKANKTFETLETVQRVANIWANGTSNLKAMMDAANDTEDLRNALENDFIRGVLKATIGVSPESIISGLDALQANNFGETELRALETAARLVSNLTSCLDFDRFVGMDSEEDLEREAYVLSQRKIFFAGIVFLNSEDNANGQGRKKRQSNQNVPKHVSYKIRMDVDNVMDTNHLKSPIWTMVAEDNFVEYMRYMRGFIQLQDMLDHAIIDIHKDPLHTVPGARLKQMPFPCHHIDNFIFILGSYMVPVMMTFVFLASIGVATYNLVYDRENGQEQSLQVMGMISGINFVVWLLSTMLLMAVVSFIMAIMLKYTDIFIYSNYFLLFLYILDFCLSSMMLLYMVSAFFNRTTMAILFVLMIYLISYLPYILVISLEVTMEFWQKILACLASTTAFSFGAHNLAKLEEIGEGLQWFNINSETSENFSVHWACMMMLIDSVIYFLIGWYVRHVKPGKYGIAQPWYFPFKPSFWSSCLMGCCKHKTKTREHVYEVGHLFEASPQDLEVGIAIENLSKSYGKKQALKSMTLNIYKGQITCLLGHNGAAKTTTLKMLYGLLEPTSGRIRINGKKPSECKNVLGICPQQNALFDYMSVIDHMQFYAGIKQDQKDPKIQGEIKKLLFDVDLWHERKVQARDLSYGMKRRLCVALAFVGGSDTVILDEPTSGIDPHARRNIWNLITSNRTGRTIVLSTHHLDEADIIGDCIAIMHTGKLLCCGSPAFLKRMLGGGFKLSIMKTSPVLNADALAETSEETQARSENANKAILNFITSMSPEAAIASQMGNNLLINIPKDDSMLKVPFQLFFKALDEKSSELGIAGYGLSDTTMEEIFLKLTEQADMEIDIGNDNPAMQEDHDTKQHEDAEIGLSDESFMANIDTLKRKKGLSLKFQQIGALLIKRFTHFRRNWRMLLTCTFLPLLAFLIAMGFSTIRPDEGYSKALVLDPTIYGKNTYTFFKKDTDGFKAEDLTKAFRNSSIGTGTTCMADYPDLNTGFSVDCLNISTTYDLTAPFYLPRCENARQTYYSLGGQTSTVKETLTQNQLFQQNLDEQNVPLYIMRTFRDYKDKRFGGWSIEESRDNGALQIDPYVWFNSKGYHAMPSFFNSLSNGILRSHLPSTENPDDFGITAISHPIHLGRSALTMKTVENDAADAGVSLMVVIAFSFIPCGCMLYLIAERVQKEKQLQHISGVGLLMYWLTALIWDMFVFAIAVGVAVGIVCIFKTDSFYVRDNLSAFASLLLLYGWAIFPVLYLLSHFFKKGSTAFLVAFCLNLFIALVTIISLLVLQLFREDATAWRAYEECRYLYLIFPQYALGQGLMEMVANTVQYEILKRFDEDLYESPYSFDELGWHFVSLAACGFVFFIINLMIEAKKSSTLSLPKKSHPKIETMDEDVANEKERIRHASNNDVLIIDDLCKVYRRRWRKFCAVDHISFGVPEGECFGLLGVNGAGKTTTFRMLTGDLTSSYGTALLNGAKISSNSHQFRQGVGYCPQEGGLDEYLTGNETLHFHARLKGFNRSQTKAIAEELLQHLHLKSHADKTVHKYSGGTKRKLALAVAMLGNPPILYLDEPTTGMDAGTRRLAWKCIRQANRNGQSVVLTSHMMDECDALCSRIAIMVNGEIKCIGSPQHLKQKFGDGYTVVIHGHSSLLRNTAHSFINRFPGSIIQARHHNSLEIMIPHNTGHVADILTFLQEAQKDGMIEYHSLSQTTLDSVFINFAQEQSDRFYDQSSSYAPSGSKEETPTDSISSSGSPPSYKTAPDKNIDKSNVFVNPQFVNDEDVIEDNPQWRYASNITIGATTNPTTEYDNVVHSAEPQYVSNIEVRKKPEPEYNNTSICTKL